MKPEIISLSVIKVRPGYLALGQNEPANLILKIFTMFVLGGAIASLLSSRWTLGGGLALASALLEANRRWMNRCHLTIENRQVRFVPLRTKDVITYSENHFQADIYSFPADGYGMHHSARLTLSHPAIPDILIQDSLRWHASDKYERATAEANLRKIKIALQLP